MEKRGENGVKTKKIKTKIQRSIRGCCRTDGAGPAQLEDPS